MSYQAVNWALAQDVHHSAAKFLLVVMAHRADKNTWESFMAVKSMTSCTGQDRKTVIVNVARLIEGGFIADTKRRVGETGQIPVYLINGTKNGTASDEEADDENQENGTKIGTAKEAEQSQIRESLESDNSTVFPHNSTVFPLKESQISLETVPNLVPVIEHLIEKQKKEKKTQAVEVPDWMPEEAWNGFLEFRKEIKQPMTPRGTVLAIAKLKELRDAGQNVEAVLNQSVLSNWKGLFAVKADASWLNKGGGTNFHDDRKRVMDELTGRNRNAAVDEFNIIDV